MIEIRDQGSEMGVPGMAWMTREQKIDMAVRRVVGLGLARAIMAFPTIENNTSDSTLVFGTLYPRTIAAIRAEFARL